MARNIVRKILENHLIYGDLRVGEAIGLKIDEVYTQDATGTMAWLQFEAMGIDKVKVPLAVSYVDHSMIQANFMNADDHAFLQSAAARFGAYFSRPGNGICHQVNLERFSAPGKIALGTDSHTPTNGGMGMMAIGVGGLDAATVMAGSPFEITMPKVTLVKLKGSLTRPWVTAMDVILEVLRRLTVKGGVGRILEYGGEGVSSLSVTERATITNMGAELGATTSIFPSDDKTLKYLKAQSREDAWIELKADENAEYDEIVEIDLNELEPLIAKPHSPDAVVPVREMAGTRIDQVCIGSCTNSSYQTMRAVASLLRGKQVAGHVNLLINPGSKQVSEMIAKEGCIGDMIGAGARLLESSCGPCIGMGGTPGTNQISVRTYNRNFKGRSGNKEAFVYLANPLVCVVMALAGEMVDPSKGVFNNLEFKEPETYLVNDNMIVPPLSDRSKVTIKKGPNIKDVPVKEPLKDELRAVVLIKTGDNITTDDIMPAGAKVLPFRSNIPAISDFVFSNLDKDFSTRASKEKERGGGIIIGGENYGQGSSREHAAIAPMYLGVQAVIVSSFARIHRANLINFGILPLLFKDSDDNQKISHGDLLEIKDLIASLSKDQLFTVENITSGLSFICCSDLNERERDIVFAGGLLPYTMKMQS